MYDFCPLLVFVDETNCGVCEVCVEAEETVAMIEMMFCVMYKPGLKEQLRIEHYRLKRY